MSDAAVTPQVATQRPQSEASTQSEAGPPAAGAAAPPLLVIGSLLGPYRLLGKLGEGGMGAVYKAQHEHLDKTVAIKVLPALFTANAAAVARFRREMKAVGKVTDPHIVQAFDAGDIGGVHYLAMEYVAGTDLTGLVQTRGPLSVPNACKLIRQAAQALAAAHGAGLVHRDVKPSNLLLSTAGHVKLLDLGLARLAEVP
jgi:serine/threonine protein kinase